MRWFTLLCLAALYAPAARAANPPVPAKRPAPARPSRATPAPRPDVARDAVLWDSWFTITVNKNIHYAYYNEHAERKQGRLIFRTQTWKQEEGYINEEQVGVFATANAQLTPLFYNFHSTYRSTETTIDGNVKDGRMLTVKVRKGDTDFPLIQRSIQGGTFFSELFPFWIERNVLHLKPGQSAAFNAILEDNIELNFAPIPGRIQVEPPDLLANRTHTTKILVDYHDVRSNWWVERDGETLRIEIPAQKTIVDRATKDDARKFLDE